MLVIIYYLLVDIKYIYGFRHVYCSLINWYTVCLCRHYFQSKNSMLLSAESRLLTKMGSLYLFIHNRFNKRI